MDASADRAPPIGLSQFAKIAHLLKFRDMNFQFVLFLLQNSLHTRAQNFLRPEFDDNFLSSLSLEITQTLSFFNETLFLY